MNETSGPPVRVALVTGGGSGMGRAAAMRFALSGATVIVADVNELSAAQVAGEITARGGTAFPCAADVSSSADCERMVSLASERFGRLDFVFNNAGIVPGSAPPATHDFPIAEWRRMIDIDLSGVFNSLRAELPLLVSSGGGAIVNNASVQAQRAFPRTAGYTAAKHGILGLTKSICLEYGALGIRCNAIGPGMIETPASAATLAMPQWRNALLERIPLRRIGTVDDVAEAVVWLCSPGAAYISGVFLPVDGGFLAT